MPTDDDMPEKTPSVRNLRDWTDWLWPVFPLLGVSLLLPWGPDWLRTFAAVVLWAFGGAAFLLFLGSYSYLAAGQIVEQPQWTHRPQRIRPIALIRPILSIACLVVGPLAAGRPYLAGCFAMLLVMKAGMPDPKGQEAQRDPERPRRVSKAIYWTLVTVLRWVGWCLELVAQGVVGLGMLAVAAWDRTFPSRNRKLARLLRAALVVPAGAVYFVYAEQHQYDWFLGPGGVLQTAIGRVVVRNWRRDISRVSDPNAPPPPLPEAERTLLDRFKVSNMREHLPFAVIIGTDDHLYAVHLSKPYRHRRRDGGAALRDAENRLRLFIACTE